MEALVEKGMTKGIGVSNFNIQLIWDLLTYAKIKPAVNQVELNPQNVQPELVKFLKAKGIQPVGYSPVARPGAGGDDWPDLRENEYLQGLGKKYGKTVVQVMLHWGISKGHVVIPKATSLEHQVENFNIFDFQLTDEEIAGVDKLNTSTRFCNKVPFAEGFDTFA